MRRLGMFAFLTIAFCPSIGLLLMLAYAAMADGLDWFSSPADLMLLGLWGVAVLLLAALAVLGAIDSAKHLGEDVP